LATLASESFADAVERVTSFSFPDTAPVAGAFRKIGSERPADGFRV